MDQIKKIKEVTFFPIHNINTTIQEQAKAARDAEEKKKKKEATPVSATVGIAGIENMFFSNKHIKGVMKKIEDTAKETDEALKAFSDAENLMKMAKQLVDIAERIKVTSSFSSFLL